MKTTSSLQQKSQSGNSDSNLTTRQYELNLWAQFAEHKSINGTLKQSETAKLLGCSNSTLQRYKEGIKMFLPNKIRSYSNKRKQNTLNCETDLERPQKTSNDLKRRRKNCF